MKKLNLRNLLSTFWILAMILSCQNDPTPSSESIFEDATVSAAKNWYNQKVVSLENLRVRADTNAKQKQLPPNWFRSRKDKLDENYEGLIVETDSFKLGNKEVGFYRVFIFKEKGGKILDGRIVEFYGKNEFIEGNKEKLPKQYRSKKIAGFTGAILSYDVNYNYLEGYAYSNGNRENSQPIFPKSRSGKLGDPTIGRSLSTLRTQTEEGAGCWDVYWDTFQYSCMCVTSSVYLYTYCNDSGGSGGNFPPGTSGGEGTPVSPSHPVGNVGIKNELKDPCLTAVWDLVKTSNFNNVIQNILYEFNMSQSIQLVFKEEFNTSKPKTPGSIPVGSNVITFNTYALAYSTKEAVLTTIIHEVLHYYLNGCTQLDDHNFMTTNYIEPMTQLIEAWFVNIPHDHAEALAWFGLGSTDAWRDITPQNRNIIIGKEELYFNWSNLYNPTGQYGSPC